MVEKNFILFDDDCRDHLLPFTFTRPVPEIRIGIFTIREKWQRSLNAKPSYFTQPYLQAKFPRQVMEVNWLINGSVLPDPRLVAQLKALLPGEAIVENDLDKTGQNLLIACCMDQQLMPAEQFDTAAIISACKVIAPANPPRTVRKLTDIFSKNNEALRDDYKLVTYKRRSATIYESNKVVNRNDVFIEEGAKVEFAYLNASKGPIYIGRNAEVMEGAMIRGPFSLGDFSEVRMGAKIYQPTTVGPYCKVGGEISGSVIFGYSNKAHEGFLGNSVIGEWCNLGADTNNSNLKNDYGDVKLYDYAIKGYHSTGLQFCGMMMGDHSKCGINSMFNTGTVVGVFANIFGGEFPGKFVPSFSWGNPSRGFEEYKIEKAIEVAKLVMERKGVKMQETDEATLRHIMSLSNK